MQEILDELIKSYSGHGPPKECRQFYSNLRSTSSIQEHLDVTLCISKALCYLEENLDPKTCFQCEKWEVVSEDEKEPAVDSCVEETLTSIVIFDLLGFMNLPEKCKIKTEMMDNLAEYITPDSGLSPIYFLKHESNGDKDCPEEHGNDVTSDPKMTVNDCNTTALGISVLLRQGLMSGKPAESIAALLQAAITENSESPTTVKMHPWNLIAYANMLRLQYQLNLECTDFSDFLENILSNSLFAKRKYSDGNNDIVCKSCSHSAMLVIMYFLSRAITFSSRAYGKFSMLLCAKVRDLGVRSKKSEKDSAVELAMILLTVCSMEEANGETSSVFRHFDNDHSNDFDKLYEKLLSLQQSDGSWTHCHIVGIVEQAVKVDSSETCQKPVKFLSTSLTTAFACAAICEYWRYKQSNKNLQKAVLHAANEAIE